VNEYTVRLITMSEDITVAIARAMRCMGTKVMILDDEEYLEQKDGIVLGRNKQKKKDMN